MATIITGPDSTAPQWPVNLNPTKALTRPTGYTTPGMVTEAAVIASLSDGIDTLYIQQQTANQYFRYQVGSYALPFGARVASVTPVVRARMATSNVRNDWVIFQGDHSGPKYATKDHLPSAHYPLSSATAVRSFSGPSVKALANGQLITQADLERGLYVAFGLNTIYGASSANATARVTEAKLQMTYDMAPTAVLTGVAAGGTINDTASPLITWDYSDDFQPQAKYSLTLTDNTTGLVVYSSGLITSSDTSHQVTTNLSNSTYTVSLRVYQAWSGPGGDFASLNPVTSTFTVNVLKLGMPRITTSTTDEQTAITVYPDVNLLSFDDSSFDRGYLPLSTSPVNCTVSAATTPVKDGAGSVKVTITNVTNPTVNSKQQLVLISPLQQFNALVHVNPVALSGRSAQLKMNFRNSAGTILSTASGSVTALTANTWNALTIINATAPLLATSLDYSITFTGTSVSDALYVDNAAVWHGGGTTRTNLATNPSFEGSSTAGYSASGNSAPTLSVISTDAYSGTKCMKVTATGGNTFFPSVTTSAFTTVIGARYTVSAKIKLPTAGGVSQVYSLLQGSSIFGSTVTDKDTWVTSSVTFYATAASHSVAFAFGDSDLVTGDYFYVDAVLIEQADTALSPFDGSSPGATWTGTANASTSTIVSSFPVWSRGGFYETTPNLLSYDDSTVEGDSYVWTPTSTIPTTWSATSAAASTDRAIHGSRSLKLVAASTTNVFAQLGTSKQFACTPGETIYTYAQVYATAANRNAGVFLYFYTSAGVPISGGANGAVTANAWTASTTATVAPANAAYFMVSVGTGPSSGSLVIGEAIYFDAIAVYRASQALGYVPGAYPNTDDAPTLVVEYTEDDVNWTELDRTVIDTQSETETFYDYSVRSGVTRTYHAYLTVTENSIQLTSDYSSESTVDLTLESVWIAADSDPIGTSHNFVYDGTGRSRVLGADPSVINIEGRPYGFAEFGSTYSGQVSVSLQLASDEDQAALEALALTKSEVVFRDQRGRSYRGVMGSVNFSDEAYGQTASFTLQLSGNQP